MSQLAPVQELVNAFEFEAVARRRLDSETFAEIAGSDRAAFDRITFRPRMMVNTSKLDLTTRLFGQELFSPILIAPVERLKRFHPEGELEMMRGAEAAKALMVVAADSSFPRTKKDFWCQVYPEPEMDTVAARVRQAGCKAVCLTLGVPHEGRPVWDWKTIARFREGIGMPLLLKGIMRAEEARMAAENGVAGIVISNYAGPAASGLAAPIEVLPAIAAALGGKIPILIDGGFRRGSDILKALALGARAVLVGRPALWGLAGYGASGVQNVIELLQTELARDMAMCGRVNLAAIDASAVKIHRW